MPGLDGPDPFTFMNETTETDRRALSRLLPLVVAPLLVLLGGWLFERYWVERQEHRERLAVVSELGTVRARLEGVMSRNLNLVQGLRTWVAFNPDITQEEFGRLGRALFELPSQLRNVALAKGMVVSHIYPVTGNERVLGLDYRTHPQQSAAARRVVETGKMVVAGPLDLVQGGVGFVARAPVYLSEEATGSNRFWGLMAAVIGAEAVYREAGLYDIPSLQIAIRGRDALGERGGVFFGDPALFAQEVVTQAVTLPYGSWQLAARPAGGWGAAIEGVWQLRVSVVIFAAGVFILSLLWVQVQRRSEEVERHLARTRATLMAALEQMPSGFILADARTGWIQAANPAALKIHGLKREEVLGKGVEQLQLKCPASRPDGGCFVPAELPLARALRRGESAKNVEMVLRWGEADEVRVMANAAPILDERGEMIAAMAVLSDVTEMKRAEERIRYRAYFDALTGLPNRTYFLELLERAVREARRLNRETALLFIDLDRFKNVNDTLGHDEGDRLLKAVASRLRASVRESDTVARLGGDEFTVILTNLAPGGHVTVITEKLMRRLAEPCRIGAHEIHPAASIGITLCPADGDDPQTLLKNADMAMYRAKEQGRNTFCYFTQEMTERAEHFMAIETDLRHALDNDELFLEFQPVIHAPTRKLAGFEALVRWAHPERGRLGPDQFIPVAEETGQIVELGEWVLGSACQTMVRVADALSGRIPRLSVNVSSRQFRGGFGPAVVEAILARTGFPADRLLLEITESLLMDEDVHVRKALLELRELGVGLSVDDFGTGYSALGYLRRFPATLLKIDKSFIADLGRERRNTNLVTAIIAMARSLDLRVVAEGVETREQASMLLGLGCDYLQGYLFGRPASVQNLVEYVTSFDSAALPLDG
ncbi:MAG: EAL domain-containing protein [Gammaproteobacteria bacterium]